MIDIVDVESDLIQLCPRSRAWPASSNVNLIRDGDGLILVDAGLGVEPAYGALESAMTAALTRWGRKREDIHTILLTHTHTDHAGGTVPIARATGARVLLPARGWAQAVDPWWQVHHVLPLEVHCELAAHRDIDVSEHFRRENMPELFSADAGIEWRLLDEGEAIPAGRYQLTAHYMPGHDVGHFAYVDERCGLAFTGDLLAARGTSLPWYPPNAGGVEGYLDSLERLSRLPLEIVCPGHHKVQRGGAAISKLIRSTEHTISRRTERLLEAMLSRPSSFAELDDLVYDATVRDVIPWASSVTMAHLRHLERTGLVSRQPDGRFIAEPIAAERYLIRCVHSRRKECASSDRDRWQADVG